MKQSKKATMTNEQFDMRSNQLSVGLAAILFVVSLISAFLKFTYYIGFWSVIIVDIYLFYVLLYAGLKSDKFRPERWPLGFMIPNRSWGILVFLLLYATVVNSFAAMFYKTDAPNYDTVNMSVYESFVGLSAFNYEDYSKLGRNLWRLQMWQTGNGLLLLTAAFGFLVSRLSTFKTKEEGVDEFQAKIDSLGGTIKTKKEEINELNKKIRDKKKSIKKDLVTEATGDTDENI